MRKPYPVSGFRQVLWAAAALIAAATMQSSVAQDANKDMPPTTSTAGQKPLSSPPPLKEAVVSRPGDYQVLPQSWGTITWYVSRQLKNSDTMTIGQAVIKAGQENPRHFHPNCDEVLHVLKGHILHSMNDRTVEMRDGDTVSIPMGVEHNAKNIGTEDAVLAISFSSADRQVVGE
jgi:quercetin dioxygenase-like cupin family protein